MTRPVYEIAQDIIKDWSKIGKGVSPYAKPYLEAMLELNSINDNFMLDTGKSVVLYGLSNMGSYRGETARKLKSELKQLAGVQE